MKYRDINSITKDLDEVNSILFNLKRSLINNPDNPGLKTNILTMEYEKKDLLQELENTKNHLGRTSFDIHIANNDGGKVELDNLSKVGGAIQDLINSCSMFDGINRVKKRSSMNKLISNNTTLQVDAIESGSLSIYVSSKEEQASLNNETYLQRGLMNLNDIISCGDDERLLLEMMKKIGNQPIFKYKKLLGILKNKNLNLDMYYSVIPEGFETQKLTNEFAKKVYKVIDDSNKEEINIISITGELYTIDTHENSCGLEVLSGDLPEGSNISFNFSDEFKNVLKNKLEENISIILNMVVESNPVEDTESKHFDLVEIL